MVMICGEGILLATVLGPTPAAHPRAMRVAAMQVTSHSTAAVALGTSLARPPNSTTMVLDTTLVHSRSPTIGVGDEVTLQDPGVVLIRVRLQEPSTHLPWRCWVLRRLSAHRRLRGLVDLRVILPLRIQGRFTLRTGSRSGNCNEKWSSRIALSNNCPIVRHSSSTTGLRGSNPGAMVDSRLG